MTKNIKDRALVARGTLGPSTAPHIQGPWTLEFKDSGESFARMSGFGAPQQVSGATRIAALWNACRNISTAALESGVIEEMVEALMCVNEDAWETNRLGEYPVVFDDREALGLVRNVLIKLTEG